MYPTNYINDIVLFLKALISNQLAKYAPETYTKLTHQTGRGSGEEHPTEIAEYFIKCFHDYRLQIGLDENNFINFLKEKNILEYGPGDILGVAFLMYAYGAKKVDCVDSFPLARVSDKSINVYEILLNSIDKDKRDRASKAFNIKDDPKSGFNTDMINYCIKKDGLSGGHNQYDLVISRAVLEHVNNLEKIFKDIKEAMKDNGLSIHQVDLKSHGLDRYTEFDFLAWPGCLYNLMYSYKGFPNRWRVNKYIELANAFDLKIKHISPTDIIDMEKLDIVYPKLRPEFRVIPREQLSWLGFWIHLEHC